jgi:hypothetical protein
VIKRQMGADLWFFTELNPRKTELNPRATRASDPLRR